MVWVFKRCPDVLLAKTMYAVFLCLSARVVNRLGKIFARRGIGNLPFRRTASFNTFFCLLLDMRDGMLERLRA